MILSLDCFRHEVLPFLPPLARWTLNSACPELDLHPIEKHRHLFWKEAITSNNSQLVQWMSQDNHLLINLEWFTQVASFCSLEVVESVIDQVQSNNKEMKPLAANSDLAVHELLEQHKFRWTNHIFDLAALNGDLPLMKWLIERKYRITPSVFASAAEYGCEDRLEWLYDELARQSPLKEKVYETKFWNSWTFAKAAKHGNLDLLLWLRRFGCSMQGSALLAAIEGGHLDAVEWLIYYGCAMDENTFKVALIKGNESILDLLREKNCPFSRSDCAWHGKFPFAAKYLDEGPYEIMPSKKELVELAVDENDFAKLEWLKSNKNTCTGYTMGIQEVLTADLFHRAVMFGTVEMVKWLYHQGSAPSSSSLLFGAISSGDCDVVAWLLDHGFREEAERVTYLAGSVAMIDCLESKGLVYDFVSINMDEVFDKIVLGREPLPSVPFLKAHGFQPPEKHIPLGLLKRALEDNALDLVEWLTRNVIVPETYHLDGYSSLIEKALLCFMPWGRLNQKYILKSWDESSLCYDQVFRFYVKHRLVPVNRVISEGSLELIELDASCRKDYASALLDSKGNKDRAIALLDSNGNKKIRQWVLNLMQ